MNKITLFIILFICSCGNHEILPSSTGSNNEIIIVSSLDIWNSGKSNAIRQKFSADIIGINQSEPMFNLIPIQPKNFKSIFKTHKHIILLSNEGDCLVQKNKWAKEQLVCQINIQLEKEDKITNNDLANRAIKKGFNQLLDRILLSKDMEKLKDLNFSQIKELVTYYQVKNIPPEKKKK